MSARAAQLKPNRAPGRARRRSRMGAAKRRLKRSPPTERPADDWGSVRTEQVARARKLVRRKSYPSKRVLKAVAGLLARRLQT